MVRNYIRKKGTEPRYSEDKLNRALEEIRTGRLTIHKASILYGVPFSTLYCRVKGTRGSIKTTRGRTIALGESIEDFLAVSIKTLAKWSFGLSRKEILELVGDFVCKNDIKTPFKNGLPGEDWFLNFKKRHNLSIRKPEPLEYARKKAATDPFIIYGYFNLLKKTLVEMDLENAPYRIWNLDESYLSIDPSKSKVVGERGQKSSRVISSSGRENTTFVLACSATGQRVPPLIIFKGKNIWDQWKAPPDKEFPGTAYAATPNGWMETKIFKTYFEKTLVPALGDKRPVFVIYDGHSTHVSLDLIEYAKDQGITILKLPAHTSDILQPLDVCVFKSYKDKWDQTVATWQRQHIGQKLPKSLFSQFLGETWTTVSEDVIRNGFRKAGIFPFNTDVVPKENFSKDAIERWEKHQRQSDGNVQNNMELAEDFGEIHSTIHRNTSSPSILWPSASRNTVSSETQSPISHSQRDAACNTEISQTTSIEQIILSRIQQKNVPSGLKRRKVASGAEVITSTEMIELLKLKEQTQSAKKVTKKKSTKKEADSKKTVNSGKKQNNKKQKRKKGRKESDDSESDEGSEDEVPYADSDTSCCIEDEDLDEEYSSDTENKENIETPEMKAYN
nr:unnamed protein product [Callosobruchus analis]